MKDRDIDFVSFSNADVIGNCRTELDGARRVREKVNVAIDGGSSSGGHVDALIDIEGGDGEMISTARTIRGGIERRHANR